MQCESCGAPLAEAKCLYCGRKNAEFLQIKREEITRPHYSNGEIIEATIMPDEHPQMIYGEKSEAADIDAHGNRQEKTHAVIKFLLCLFLGMFGAHYFYEKKFGLGLLYLFTWGLFWIGWFVDCIRLLVNLIRVSQYD